MTTTPESANKKPYAVDSDEYYPFYMARPAKNEPDGSLCRHQDIAYFTDEEYADYQRVSAEFEGWQTRLREAEIVR